ncbi:MAG: hypothetical protein K8I00_04370, partial [Candidatus Omnitrophica bacterium]|nr:hypothetical protein [Candidatus Omnitrophota bacterium]
DGTVDAVLWGPQAIDGFPRADVGAQVNNGRISPDNKSYEVTTPTSLAKSLDAPAPDSSANLAGVIETAVFVDTEAFDNIAGFFVSSDTPATPTVKVTNPTEQLLAQQLIVGEDKAGYQEIIPVAGLPNGYITAGSNLRAFQVELNGSTVRNGETIQFGLPLTGNIWDIITTHRMSIASDNIGYTLADNLIANELPGTFNNTKFFYVDGSRGSIVRYLQKGGFDVVGGRAIIRTDIANRGKVVMPIQGTLGERNISNLIAGGATVDLPEEQMEFLGQYGDVDQRFGLGGELITLADGMSLSYNQFREDAFGSNYQVLMRINGELEIVNSNDIETKRKAGGIEVGMGDQALVRAKDGSLRLVAQSEVAALTTESAGGTLVQVVPDARVVVIKEDGTRELVAQRNVIFGERNEIQPDGSIKRVTAVETGLENVSFGFAGLSAENRLQISYDKRGVSRIYTPAGAEAEISAGILNGSDPRSSFVSGVTNYSFGKANAQGGMDFLFTPFVGFGRDETDLQPKTREEIQPDGTTKTVTVMRTIGFHEHESMVDAEGNPVMVEVQEPVMEDLGGSFARSYLYAKGGTGFIDVSQAVRLDTNQAPAVADTSAEEPKTDEQKLLDERQRARTASNAEVEGTDRLTDAGYVIAPGLQDDARFLQLATTGRDVDARIQSGEIRPFNLGDGMVNSEGQRQLNTIVQDAKDGTAVGSRLVFRLGTGAEDAEGDRFSGQIQVDYSNANFFLSDATRNNPDRGVFFYDAKHGGNARRVTNPDGWFGVGPEPTYIALDEKDMANFTLRGGLMTRAWGGSQVTEGRIFKAVGADQLTGFMKRNGTMYLFGAQGMYLIASTAETGLYEGIK